MNEQLLAYLEAHRGSARYLLATLNSQTAAPYIIASGQPVIALGGFSGSDQILSVSQLQALVSSGAIRYFLLDGGGGGFGGQGGGNGQLVSWVTSNCTQVAASEYGGDIRRHTLRLLVGWLAALTHNTRHSLISADGQSHRQPGGAVVLPGGAILSRILP